MKVKEVLLQDMIDHLLDLCRRELYLTEMPEIELVNEPSVGQGTSFGEFNGAIRVVILNRHPMDIMRTLTHELVHWKQDTVGLDMDGSDGSKTENDANAIAGVIMRKFGKKYPEYFLQSIP